MTGNGLGQDILLSCSSCAGSGGGSWYNSMEEYWRTCWPQGMGGVGTLGMGGIGGDS